MVRFWITQAAALLFAFMVGAAVVRERYDWAAPLAIVCLLMADCARIEVRNSTEEEAFNRNREVILKRIEDGCRRTDGKII